MITMFKRLDADTPVPFRTGEDAWFWTMAALLARQDGAGPGWRPDGPTRPCEPDDVIRCLDTLYQRKAIVLSQVRILRHWGERQVQPRAEHPEQAAAFRAWQQAMGHLEWALRGRGIVR